MSVHPKYTARCLLQEAFDVDRRSYVDGGFRCRLRPSRLDVDKTEARHEKSSWRLSISARHDACRAARVSDGLGRSLVFRRTLGAVSVAPLDNEPLKKDRAHRLERDQLTGVEEFGG